MQTLDYRFNSCFSKNYYQQSELRKKAYEVGIIPTKSDTIMINKDIFEKLGITIGTISDTIMYTHLNQG